MEHLIPQIEAAAADNVVDDVIWMEVKACIECRGREQLLVCCGIDCSFCVHEKCAKFKITFDDLGWFYCIYCSHKREAARAKKLEEKVMLVKKALFSFINSETVVVEEESSGGEEREDAGKRVEIGDADQQARMGEDCRDNTETDDALLGAKPSKKAPLQPHTTVTKEAANQNNRATAKKPRERVKLLKTARKRVHWRSDEKDMIRLKGVAKFAKPGQKNIRWRKILDYGHKVFDSTRTPTDLKDKWRNMTKRVG